MSAKRIPKTETELLSVSIDKIISTEVLEKNLSGQLPLINDFSDSNMIYQGKATMLFVDMRESSKLPDKFNAEQLVKIYRSYIRTVVQAIRYSGGVVRDFLGDGVLAVFVDNDEGLSEDKAVHTARYITTAIDMFLNPVLDQVIKHRISCGIGIHTGDISLSKVGMKGKEQNDDAENEFGIAWIGNSTNLACKFSGAVDNGTIFISSSTYIALSDMNNKQNWKQVEILKGTNVLCGYEAKKYYLEIDEGIEPCVAISGASPLNLADDFRKELQTQISDLATRAETLGQKEQQLKDREQALSAKAAEVTLKENGNRAIELALREREYLLYCNILGSGHCKTAYVKAMGVDFWEKYLQKTIDAGKKIEKDEHEIKQEVSYAMVSIYEDLEMFDKAYDFLVEQAVGYAWLNLSTVQDIVRRVKYCDRLKSALYTRLAKNDLSPENRIVFEKIKNWLVFEYRT